GRDDDVPRVGRAAPNPRECTRVPSLMKLGFEAARDSCFQCPRFANESTPITAHQLVKSLAIVIHELSFAISFEQLAELLLRGRIQFFIAGREELIVGKQLYGRLRATLIDPVDQNVFETATGTFRDHAGARHHFFWQLNRDFDAHELVASWAERDCNGQWPREQCVRLTPPVAATSA